ncbi:hypothetical protein VSDG_04759 [Cytospora chrysosperma]|uniref:AB hydrolase-1 domain-containing protein n=1 Tax=Cytospora chrysosperma TaxID=252740 RepID=A0A423W1L4_CYTCH|nr:hypothetical protein VSDG_04759 [Valsa sordida]
MGFPAEAAQRIAKLANGISLEYIDLAPLGDSRVSPCDETPGGLRVKPIHFPGHTRRGSQADRRDRYRVIAPNYRGAGRSSKPATGFTKSIMAEDIVHLLDHLGITTKVHVVGHDIGGMIAYSLATRHPHRLLTVNWGECPLPGTSAHEHDRTDRAVDQFHFIFHSVRDLPEALVAGREAVYLGHFFDKLAANAGAIGPADREHYATAYSQPGAMRCAFEVYRAFLEDAEENRAWVARHGRCAEVPAVCLSGGESAHCGQAEGMFAEVHEQGTYQVEAVPGAGHFLAEENPEGFVEKTLAFVRKHDVG